MTIVKICRNYGDSMKKTLLTVALLGAYTLAQASDLQVWNQDQQQVLEAMEQLSDTTAIGGAGADAYGALLADDFGRWTVGSNLVNDKTSWVDGVRGWFEDGWRVGDRDAVVIEIVIRGDYAFTRRTMSEAYIGPDKEKSNSSAALAEVWIRSGNRWQLLLVNVHPQDAS